MVFREITSMNMRSHVSGTTAVLELSGRFDSYVAPKAAEWLEKITIGSPAHVVVNMAEVNFVDSTGLATLVQGLNRPQTQWRAVFVWLAEASLHDLRADAT